MKLKYYVGLVVVVILAMGVYLYSITPENFQIAMPLKGEEQLVLPMGAWISIFGGFFIILALLFFAIDWIYARVKSYQNQKDFQKLIGQILDQTSKDNFTPVVYKNPLFLVLSKVLRRFKLQPKLLSQNSGIGKIDQLFEMLNQINLGYDQDLKKYGFTADCEFFIQNIFNKIKKDYKYGFGVLMDGDFSPETKKEVFLQILDKCNQKEILKMLETTTFLDKTMVFEAIKMFKKHQESLNETKMAQFFKKAEFEKNDYVELAKHLKECLSPDEWLKFFENLTLIDEKSELGFLYILCDLEMNNQVIQRLSGMDKNDFLSVRAYIDLRAQGKTYPLDLFFKPC